MKVYAQTDIGMSREINQDYLFASEGPVGNLSGLFIVADGMGGHASGEFASKFTVEEMVKSISRNTGSDPAEILAEAVRTANAGLIAYAEEHPQMYGMGTTVVAAALRGTHLYAANVGDSRLYLAGNSLRQVTVDHSLVQQMVRIGELKPEEARNHPDKNIITRAVGADSDIHVDLFEEELSGGDIILLCSDGLTNMVEDAELFAILKGSDADLQVRGSRLVELANANGGRDNITVIAVQMKDEM